MAVLVVIVADFPSPFSFVFGSFGFASLFDLRHNALINRTIVLGLRVLKDQFIFKCLIAENNGYKVLQVLILLLCLFSLVSLVFGVSGMATNKITAKVINCC